jgi:hypothetical protein
MCISQQGLQYKNLLTSELVIILSLICTCKHANWWFLLLLNFSMVNCVSACIKLYIHPVALLGYAFFRTSHKAMLSMFGC